MRLASRPASFRCVSCALSDAVSSVSCRGKTASRGSVSAAPPASGKTLSCAASGTSVAVPRWKGTSESAGAA